MTVSVARPYPTEGALPLRLPGRCLKRSEKTKVVPHDAKRIPPEVLRQGQLDVHTGHEHSWTTVQGVATARIQTEDGMGKGQPVYEIAFSCPRCEEQHKIQSTQPHSDTVLHYADPGTNSVPCPCGKTGYPVRCYCDATLVFAVSW